MAADETARRAGENLFTKLVAPISPRQFLDEYWERKPLVIHRKNSTYYEGWASISVEDVEETLRTHELPYKRHVDVTRCLDGVRQTLNPTVPGQTPADMAAMGAAALKRDVSHSASACSDDEQQTTEEEHEDIVANADDVMSMFRTQGCTVRVVHPERFMERIWELIAPLQEFFTSTMGANIYLTPAGAQGFAPHYDDVEVFVLQVSGSKRWRLHAPIDDESILPRYSSRDFHPDEVGPPERDVLLEQGDLLYLPRGVIHQAASQASGHSLHITVSTYQKHTYYDFMLAMLPDLLAAARAADSSHTLRRGLPLRLYDFAGVLHESSKNSARERFAATLADCLTILSTTPMPIDAVADRLAARFMYDSLPPSLTPAELACMFDPDLDADAACNVLQPDTPVRLARKYVARMAVDGGGDGDNGGEAAVVISHNAANSRQYHEFEPESVRFALEFGPALETLFNAFPHWVCAEDLARLADEDGDTPLSAADVTAALQALYTDSVLVRAPAGLELHPHESLPGVMVQRGEAKKRKGSGPGSGAGAKRPKR